MHWERSYFVMNKPNIAIASLIYGDPAAPGENYINAVLRAGGRPFEDHYLVRRLFLSGGRQKCVDRLLWQAELSQIPVYGSGPRQCIAECADDPAVGRVRRRAGVFADADQHHSGISGADQRSAAQCQTDAGRDSSQECFLKRRKKCLHLITPPL